ncbi:MAG: hypothetical protein OXN25_21590 [Candidatus Poribacteria bacterium]|nr:hypothetical protein [Candidatus Poribacteria bacterium]
MILEIFGFGTETCPLATKDSATEGSPDAKFAQQAAPASTFLYSIADLDLDSEQDSYTTYFLLSLVNFVGRIHTDESYQGLTKLLNRLLTENLNLKRLLLTQTVVSLAKVSVGLGQEDSVSILKSAVSQLQDPDHNLSVLAGYFDKLNAPEGIKEILIHHAEPSEMLDLEVECLALLQKHDPKFVENRKAQKAAANTQTEESS